MRAFVFFAMAIIVQAAVFQHLKRYGFSYDAVLAVMTIMGFVGGYQRLVVPLLLAGAVLDGMSGAPFGVMTAGLVAALLALSALETFFAREHIFHFAVFAIVSAAFFSGTAFFLTMLLRPHAALSPTDVFFVIGYNSAGTIGVYSIYRWIILLKKRISGQ